MIRSSAQTVAVVAVWIFASALMAQQAPSKGPQPYIVGNRLGLPRPGQSAELIAQNIPNPASMCYDSGANQLVVPMNANNALAFVPLK